MNIIITHKHGDFDALASLIAAARLYPGSRVILPDPVQPNVQSFINLYRDLLPLSEVKELSNPPESAIVVDTARKERLGEWADLLEKTEDITVYDHHHPFEDDLGARVIKAEAVGAATTLLIEEIKAKNIALTEFEATLMALGIYEDTGCLTYELTTERDVAAVAFLWQQGISVRLLQEFLRPSLSSKQKNLLEELIRNVRLHEINQRKVMISCAVIGDYVKGAAVLLQLLDEIEDANLSFIIVQMGDNVYMAARTRDGDLDLTAFLAPFNVKGHPAAVTAHFKATVPAELNKRILSFLRAYLPPLLKAGEIASRPVFTLEDSVPVSEAARALSGKNFKGCPVTEKGALVGVISERDLQKAVRGNLEHAPVKGFMNRTVITASPEDSLTYLRRLMVEHNIGRVPLIDEAGKLDGIVTRSDLLRHLDLIDRRGRFIKKPREGDPVDKVGSGTMVSDNIADLINRELPGRLQGLLPLIGSHASEQGVSIYLVGGVIRDLFIGFPLPADLDFVVLGDAVAFAASLQQKLGGKLKHFEQFGTATLFLKGGPRLDMVTARREYYAAPAALPQVEKASLKNDLFRRDFSINTMACSLMKDNYGELYDFFDGRRDIHRKQIRVLYKLSFVDDPLRILRAVRFEQRYGFAIEAETLDLMHNAVEKKVLKQVSRQRLAHELRQIYDEPEPLMILKRFARLKMLHILYPRVYASKVNWKRLEEIREMLKWSAERKWEKQPDTELTYLNSLLYDLEKGERFAIIRKLQLSKESAEVILSSCRNAPAALEKLDKEGLYPSELAAVLRDFSLEGLLLIYSLTDSERIRSYLKLYMNNLKFVRPSICGEDLKKLGLEPGPLYTEILDKLKEAILDGAVSSPQDEIEFVLSYLQNDNQKGD